MHHDDKELRVARSELKEQGGLLALREAEVRYLGDAREAVSCSRDEDVETDHAPLVLVLIRGTPVPLCLQQSNCVLRRDDLGFLVPSVQQEADVIETCPHSLDIEPTVPVRLQHCTERKCVADVFEGLDSRVVLDIGLVHDSKDLLDEIIDVGLARLRHGQLVDGRGLDFRANERVEVFLELDASPLQRLPFYLVVQFLFSVL
mmetsp:Transcript_27026/g.59774  ORF Transcript_27026/g.59774 Transcript_27026/m.59774 type:complete len:203 (+) Transcript_27026:1477-2085(+)